MPPARPAARLRRLRGLRGTPGHGRGGPGRSWSRTWSGRFGTPARRRLRDADRPSRASGPVAACNEVKRIRALAAVRHLDVAKEYLARCERERAAVLAAGQPWPPKGRSNTKPRMTASTPSAAPPQVGLAGRAASYAAQAWPDTIRSKGASVTVDGEGRIVIEPDVLTDDEATELAGAAGGGGGERATLEVTSACGPDLRAAIMADREGRSDRLSVIGFADRLCYDSGAARRLAAPSRSCPQGIAFEALKGRAVMLGRRHHPRLRMRGRPGALAMRSMLSVWFMFAAF